MGMILSFALLFGFSFQDAATADEASLVLSVKADRSEVTLGEDVQLEVTLTNGGDDRDVSRLTLEKRSLSLEIKTAAFEKPFVYTLTQTDPHVADRLPLPLFTLHKGSSTNTHVRLPAFESGDMEITAIYRGGEKEIRSTTIKVVVGKSGRGDHLAAIMEIRSPGADKTESLSFRLRPDEAPVNVINFVSLVRSGFYDGMIFHRVIKGSWIQSGCPYGLGIGGPGYAIESEADGQSVKHEAGTLSIAGYEKTDYTGSQFFITLGKIPALDGKYTVIGKVSDGAKVKYLKGLGKVDVDRNNDRPRKDLELVRIRIVVE